MPNRTGQHRVVSTSKRGRQLNNIVGRKQQQQSDSGVKAKSGWEYATDYTGKVIKVRSK